MPLSFDKTVTQNFAEALLRREWLETNGLGGWASSTLAGAAEEVVELAAGLRKERLLS